jgi:predicted thioesterase
LAHRRHAGRSSGSRRSRGDQVDGKRIEFKVSACDELEEIGNGTHQRIVINLRSFNKRLAAKSASGSKVRE